MERPKKMEHVCFQLNGSLLTFLSAKLAAISIKSSRGSPSMVVDERSMRAFGLSGLFGRPDPTLTLTLTLKP